MTKRERQQIEQQIAELDAYRARLRRQQTEGQAVQILIDRVDRETAMLCERLAPSCAA